MYILNGEKVLDGAKVLNSAKTLNRTNGSAAACALGGLLAQQSAVAGVKRKGNFAATLERHA
jgi:hypothetical protein